MAVGVVGGAAVAHPDVELAVGPELELPAVVVPERLVDREQGPAARRVRDVRVARGDRVARDHGVAREVRVVDEEEAVRAVVRVERRREQPLLAAADDERREVQERRREDVDAVPDEDPAALQRDEEPRVPGVRDSGDAGEGPGDRREVQLRRHRRRPLGRRDARHRGRRRHGRDAEQYRRRNSRSHLSMIRQASDPDVSCRRLSRRTSYGSITLSRPRRSPVKLPTRRIASSVPAT